MSYPRLYDQLPTRRFATVFSGRAAAANYHGVRIARLLAAKWACARSMSCRSWPARWHAKPPVRWADPPAGPSLICLPRSTRTEAGMAAELTFAEARQAVIAALERAADTLKRLPMPRNGMPARERSSWPEIPDDPEDDSGRAPSRPALIGPRPQAISELDRVLPWLGALDGTDRRVVWARAAGLPWPRLAREFGFSVGKMRYRWSSAIDRVVIAAVRDAMVNGSGPTPYRGSCHIDGIGR